MPVLMLKFSVDLVGFEKFGGPHGPLFSYWLPDGENDVVMLDSGDSDTRLSVWFDRYGFVGANGMIYYDHSKREVDTRIVGRQAILDAGPLKGKLVINTVKQVH